MSPVDPEARKRDAARKAQLSADQQQRLARGEHEHVARELASSDPGLGAWVLEQVWDFVGATRLYVAADLPLDALRSAIESNDAALIDARVAALEQAGGQLAHAGGRLLESRRRHDAAARLFAAASDAPELRAEALRAAGDDVQAAKVWLEAGESRAALDVLDARLRDDSGASADSALAWALAARAWWELGDADESAKAAQAGLRSLVRQGEASADAEAESGLEPAGGDAVRVELEAELRARLAEALRALGHPIAAQVVLDLAPVSGSEALTAAQARVAQAGGHGRYRVLAAHPAALAGAAYTGLDRVTHEEVEVHLLLADQMESGAPEPAAVRAVQRFVERARASTAIGHAAIRPLLRAEARDGLIVMPRAAGPTLRALIRPPGLADRPERARAFVRFLAEGLAQIHRLGFAHGGVLPSLITTDALGRPQLGPAGIDLLSGLAATRTGGLDELLTLTAPELRRGADPSPAADMYALGRIWVALLCGRVDAQPREAADIDAVDPSSTRLIMAMCEEDPNTRPSAFDAAEQLRRPVRDFRDVQGGAAPRQAPGDSGLGSVAEVVEGEVVVEVAPRWTSEDLDALCSASSPWMQTITRREGRVLWLSPWPEGCAQFAPAGTPATAPAEASEDAWELLDPRATEALEPELVATLRDTLRERPGAMVCTPAGEWLLALDALLASAQA